MRDARRSDRYPFAGRVQISWEERGERRYGRGKGTDVSQSGMRIEMPVSIPVGTMVLLSAERTRISGSAKVRNVTRYGSRYLIGLELARSMKPDELEVEIVHANALQLA